MGGICLSTLMEQARSALKLMINLLKIYLSNLRGFSYLYHLRDIASQEFCFPDVSGTTIIKTIRVIND